MFHNDIQIRGVLITFTVTYFGLLHVHIVQRTVMCDDCSMLDGLRCVIIYGDMTHVIIRHDTLQGCALCIVSCTIHAEHCILNKAQCK